MHSANLILRFLLELSALGGFAMLTWRMTDAHWRYLAVVMIVLLIGTIWATFAVPNDPSRSGNAPVPVPGVVRLILEFAILFGGAWAFHAAGHTWVGLAITALVILHYLLWTGRVVWLLQQ